MKEIPFHRVVIGSHERELLTRVLDSGWLTTGKMSQEFESLFAGFVGCKYACAVNSCTAALHLALEAAGLKPGEKVFVPTLTFTATAEVVRYLNGEVVFLDVDYETGCVTPAILEAAMEKHPGTKYLIIVHFGGHPAAMQGGAGRGIADICQENGIKIIEDAAHAFPAKIGDKFVGNFGIAGAFSFYANKTLTTGEGGMVTTNDEGLYERVRLMRLHGIDRSAWNRFVKIGASWEYDVVMPGFKYNCTDIAAAIGVGQLYKAADARDKRERCAQLYTEHLAGVAGVHVHRSQCRAGDHAHHLFCISILDDAGVGRDRVIRKLAEYGIGTSVHYKPLHRMSYYQKRYSLSRGDFPQSERRFLGTISLPIYPSLTEADIEYVALKIQDALR